jgi:hypothetical protein
MGATVLPNFFIVGTGKAGTTSLYHYVQQHPAIYMSPIKEPCYFASEVRTENLTTMFCVTVEGCLEKCLKAWLVQRPENPWVD